MNKMKSIAFLSLATLFVSCASGNSSEKNIIVPIYPYKLIQSLYESSLIDPVYSDKFNSVTFFGVLNYCKDDSILLENIYNALSTVRIDTGKCLNNHIVRFYRTSENEAVSKSFVNVNSLISIGDKMVANVSYKQGKIIGFYLARDGKYYWNVLKDKPMEDYVEE